MAKEAKKDGAQLPVVEVPKVPSKIVHVRDEKTGALTLKAVPLSAEELEKGSYVGFGGRGKGA